MSLIKVLSIFGTRPEAIKMAPVVKMLENMPAFKSLVCVTGQHKEMLAQVLDLFEIDPDYDLELMKKNQDIFDIVTSCLNGIKKILMEEKPNFVLVHGDTSTALAGAMAAFFLKIPVAHVEAGLRTRNKYSPFPEEMNRTLIGHIADVHFAPTNIASENLSEEFVNSDSVYTVGNTVIDALKIISEKNINYDFLSGLWKNRKMILLTIHRRENLGIYLENILNAVGDYAKNHPNFQIVFPVHLNPEVREIAWKLLSKIDNVSLIDPLNYSELCFVLQNCHFVVTDSGGLQEESTAFNKPVLVVRDTTERPEAIEAGIAMLVGKEYDNIFKSMTVLSQKNSIVYRNMSASKNPFGDGKSAKRIIKILENLFVNPSVIDDKVELEIPGRSFLFPSQVETSISR